MQKVVWHVGAWADNYGDRVLQAANSQILTDRYGEDLKFVYVNTQKTYFSEQLIEKMNREADLLMIGGGGLVFHRPMDRSRSGWQFNIKTEDIYKIQVPVVVYGIGYNKFYHDKHEFPSYVWQNINTLAQKSVAFSVRNHGTWQTLKDNVVGGQIDIVPDAGMFIKAESFRHSILEGDHVKIGLNWATDRPDHRFKSVEESERFMREVLKVLKSVCEDLGAKVYVIEHLMPNDLCAKTKIKLHHNVKDIMGDYAYIVYDEVYEELYPPFDYTAGFFSDIYKQMDLVVGMRGHANIIPFGQSVPVIGIGRHNKVKWFLEEVGLGEYFVPLNDSDDVERLQDMCKEVLNKKDEYVGVVKSELAKCEKAKNKFIDKVVSVL